LDGDLHIERGDRGGISVYTRCSEGIEVFPHPLGQSISGSTPKRPQLSSQLLCPLLGRFCPLMFLLSLLLGRCCLLLGCVCPLLFMDHLLTGQISLLGQFYRGEKGFSIGA
jgi:hypothetical protein